MKYIDAGTITQEIGRGNREAAKKRPDAVEHVPLRATSPEAKIVSFPRSSRGSRIGGAPHHISKTSTEKIAQQRSR